MKRPERRGFTIVELLVVMLVIGILASMMVMRYIDLKHRAISAQATSAMDNVKMAAYSRFYETGQWPQAVGAGIVPSELVPYLGAGFSFKKSNYTLEFENFAPPGGGPSASYQVAVKLTTTDERLRHTMIQVIGGRSPYIVLGDDIAVILVGPDGQT